TTVRQDFAALGEAAVAALAATLDGAPPTRTVVPTTLIARASG
ncbi:LacI family transcriptional regulator, partial [Microbacterium oleivorans]